MVQLTIFDDLDTNKVIKKIKSDTNCYEVGEDFVASIQLTNHGSEKTDIYELADSDSKLLMYIGLLKQYDIEYF